MDTPVQARRTGHASVRLVEPVCLHIGKAEEPRESRRHPSRASSEVVAGDDRARGGCIRGHRFPPTHLRAGGQGGPSWCQVSGVLYPRDTGRAECTGTSIAGILLGELVLKRLLDRLAGLVVLDNQSVTLERTQQARHEGDEPGARVRDQFTGPLTPGDVPEIIVGPPVGILGQVERAADQRFSDVPPGRQATIRSGMASCGPSISVMAAMAICSVSIVASSSASSPEASDRPSVRSLSSQAVRAPALRAKQVSNSVRSEAFIRSFVSSTGTPLRMAQKRTSVWRSRAFSDSSAHTPLTSGSSTGPSAAPAIAPSGPAATAPKAAPAAAAAARSFRSRRSSSSRSATRRGYRRSPIQ
jgi:hypothetical protein